MQRLDMQHQLDEFDNRAAAMEAADDVGSNPSDTETIGDLVARRLGRRDILRGALVAGALAAAGGTAGLFGAPKAAAAAKGRYVFDEISHGVDETHHVATGYDADVLLRWGDPLFADAPAFDPAAQTEAAQLRQFGYNNDFVGFHRLSADRAVLCVNHEYTNEELMFPGLGRQDKKDFADMTPEFVAVEMAAHGGTIVEIARRDGKWAVDTGGKLNRRITAKTPMTLTGPAAGDDRLKTSADATGTKVLGTLNNCAGGMTPWGTYLMAEENFNGYFWGGKEAAAAHPHAASLKRYGIPGGWYSWGRLDARFDIAKEPNEVFRHGWVVEVDIMDPASTPKKRTAMGRFKHEGSETIVNKDGRVVIYSGDDERFDYVYKFVTNGTYNPNDRAANMDLLDDGTLYVARFDADGGVAWMPLVHGQGPLTADNGFESQADVLIDTRLAADKLGATPMDRPEDVDPNPVTNKVYVMLTNNSKRKADAVDGPNPRAENLWGQVLEITPADGDHAATTGSWDLVVQAGNPADPEVKAMWNPATTENGWFACPDNCTIDAEGRLWVTTDQGSGWKKASGTADGVWALETEGEGRGTGKMFFRVPVGAEMCGPCFTDDTETLFVAVQHVASDGTKDWAPFGRESTYDDPATRWPDFDPKLPPRPSVVMITRKGGGKIAV
ncbi:MAG: PhoX family phosphatase [Thalassobaculum sp.]|uniref:PhoX family protein n=1 Tax=Thalassobaculum sp. TaxID=2022740 RepID=UPI0032EB1075